MISTRTRNRKLLGIGAALGAAFIVAVVIVNVFTVKSWAANFVAWVVMSLAAVTAYTIVFNGWQAFWKMATGKQKETQ